MILQLRSAEIIIFFWNLSLSLLFKADVYIYISFKHCFEDAGPLKPILRKICSEPNAQQTKIHHDPARYAAFFSACGVVPPPPPPPPRPPSTLKIK